MFAYEKLDEITAEQIETLMMGMAQYLIKLDWGLKKGEYREYGEFTHSHIEMIFDAMESYDSLPFVSKSFVYEIFLCYESVIHDFNEAMKKSNNK